jgi:hypothetical protein
LPSATRGLGGASVTHRLFAEPGGIDRVLADLLARSATAAPRTPEGNGTQHTATAATSGRTRCAPPPTGSARPCPPPPPTPWPAPPGPGPDDCRPR